MRSSFLLFQSHLDLAKHYWKMSLKPGDCVIDATCGNGKDTLFLASLVLPNGTIYAFDIQEAAIFNAQCLLSTHLQQEDFNRIAWMQRSHAQMPRELEAESVAAIIYNLGYLPGGNKTLTTRTEETLKSVQEGLSLLKAGGFISLTCYPGHQEGYQEETALISFCQTLEPKEWSVCLHRFLNRQGSPSLILIQRRLKP